MSALNLNEITNTVDLANAVQNELPNVDIMTGDRTWGEIAARLEKWAAKPKSANNSVKMAEAAKLLKAAEARWFELG